MTDLASETAPLIRRRPAVVHILAENLTGCFGALIVVAVVVMAILAPVLSPYDPTILDAGARLLPPGPGHWMGTDHVGRDLLSRVIWGARPSLLVGVGAIMIGLPLGVLIGLLAGFYYGSVLDQALMRAMEILSSIPLLIWAIAVVGVLGVKSVVIGPFVFSNEVKIIALVGILYMPVLARITHSVASAEAKSDYVRARRVQGAGDFTIMVSDILPNCLSPLIVQVTLLIASGVLIEASLSFIGLGVQPPQPSWGGMLSEARNFIFSGEWWMSLFPGIAISLAVVGFNLFGDALRDFLDPRRTTGPRLLG
jgi:peptide/nickel transport system permease protein